MLVVNSCVLTCEEWSSCLRAELVAAAAAAERAAGAQIGRSQCLGQPFPLVDWKWSRAGAAVELAHLPRL